MSEETYTASAKIDANIYNGYFSECFNALWKPNETTDASWTNALRTCIQRHVDTFSIVSKVHENKPSFAIPAFGAGADEDEEEDDE